MFRLIRMLFTLAVLAVVGLLAYNWWNGNGLTLSMPSSTVNVEAGDARRDAKEAVKTTAEKASDAASKIGTAVAEGTLTTKIKAKMALDDLVKASAISVETTGSVVTLTGRVSSMAERERAVRIAQETDGVTKVVDKLQLAK